MHLVPASRSAWPDVSAPQPDNDEPHTPDLRLAALRFSFCAAAPVVADVWPGALWRGVFGRALRKQACTTGALTCQGCPVKAACAYARVFEGTYTTSRHSAVPAFTINASSPGNAREAEVALTLIGTGTQWLAESVSAIMLAAADGLGKTRQPLALRRVHAINWQQLRWESLTGFDDTSALNGNPVQHLPRTPQRVRVVLDTPWRLVRDKQPVRPEQWSAGTVVRAVAHRYDRLASASNAAAPNTRFLIAGCEDLSIPRARLRWAEASRYSARQRKALKLSGVTGYFDLAGQSLNALWPWLWTGQWIHIGKGTTSGLGGYHLRTG